MGYVTGTVGQMKQTLIMTILGADRTGLVRSIAAIVAAHQASWQESRMARLAGQFAGILRVDCPSENIAQLSQQLQKLASEGIQIHIIQESAAAHEDRRLWHIDVVGNDRPGIVHQLTEAIAYCGGNVEELVTGLESAAMSGHPLFRASGKVSLRSSSDEAPLREAIEKLSDDLSVEIH
jgi:glycine cleavage system regulatory protein